MTPENFLERIKQIFDTQNENVVLDAPNANTSHKLIPRPKKQYIKVKEILNLFEITKPVYNNILVRRKQTFKRFLILFVINFVSF